MFGWSIVWPTPGGCDGERKVAVIPSSFNGDLGMFKRFLGGLTAAVLLAGVAQAQVAADPAADRMRGHSNML